MRANRYLALAVLIVLALFGLAPAFAAEEERPTNFIFLLDVSGSMLYKSEMVTGANGEKVFLFEALRQALAQIVNDERLINPQSKACVITFGTQVTEKSDWPQKLETAQQRQKLVQLIQSADQLEADKHGDTYMGGALVAAVDKANKFYSDSDPCTTTFVVMLTDGWDEPPHGATVKVRDAAAKYVARVKQVQAKLGVKTWQALVIGLQNLPDRKAGTTTARELATLLDGEFIDVTKQAGGTVSEKIFHALKQTVENLKGEIKLAANGSAMKNGVLEFGEVNGNGTATASFPVELKSCYAEDITGVTESSGNLSKQSGRQLLDRASAAGGGNVQLIGTLPAGAITVRLAQDSYTIAPKMSDTGERSIVTQPITVIASAHNNCPPGHFVGVFNIFATAKVPQAVPFSLSVPGRLVSDRESIKIVVKKPGIFWAEPTDATIEDAVKDASGSRAQSNYTVTITPESARLVGEGHSQKNAPVEATIDAGQINDGKPVTITLDTAKSERQPFRLDVHIPARQVPGKYEGKLDVAVKGTTDIVAPTEISYQIIVEPSPWEKVAPIAIPTLIILMLVCVAWFIAWIKTLRR